MRKPRPINPTSQPHSIILPRQRTLGITDSGFQIPDGCQYSRKNVTDYTNSLQNLAGKVIQVTFWAQGGKGGKVTTQPFKLNSVQTTSPNSYERRGKYYQVFTLNFEGREPLKLVLGDLENLPYFDQTHNGRIVGAKAAG